MSNELETILNIVNVDQNLNKNNVIDKIKIALQQEYPTTYIEWKNDNSGRNHFCVQYQTTTYTLLHLATQGGHTEVTKALIEKGADVNEKDYSGCTPLHLAAENGYTEVVNALVEREADVNATNRDGGCTPLHLAAERGHIEVINVLIERGADVNATNRDGGFTPLHWAAENGHTDVVNALIERGADINAKNSDGCTPLHWAAENGHTDVVNALIERGADINATLHRAAEDGRTECTETLIKYIVLRNHKAVKPDYIDNDTELSEHWDNCQNEVRKMQNEKIGNSNVSLDEFLVGADENKLAGYLSNENTDVRSALKEGENIKKWKGDYPLYANEMESMIKSQYKKGMETRKLLTGCERVLQESTPGRYLLVDTIHLLAKEMVRSKVMNVKVESFMKSKGKEIA